jgi:(p)ppGpp synthase/HD superfamily hydrolase
MNCKYSDTFLSKINKLNKDSKDVSFIKKGLAFAKHYHQWQFRKSGEPYYSHPIAVATMVAEYIFKEDLIIASLLHDTLEDTPLTLGEIESEFSPRIAQMVDRLTRKIDRLTGKKMSAGGCLLRAYELEDTEVMIIKGFDRLHNIITFNFISEEKQKKILYETIDIFLPIFSLAKIPFFINNFQNIIQNEL